MPEDIYQRWAQQWEPTVKRIKLTENWIPVYRKNSYHAYQCSLARLQIAYFLFKNKYTFVTTSGHLSGHVVKAYTSNEDAAV